jgi:hypothetical protein
LKKASFETSFSNQFLGLIGARVVETRRLSSYGSPAFQAVGQLQSHHGVERDVVHPRLEPELVKLIPRGLSLDHHGVALQVEFERQILKPVFHLIGFRLWV